MTGSVSARLRQLILSLAAPLPGESRAAALHRVAVMLGVSDRAAKGLFYGQADVLSVVRAEAVLARRAELLRARLEMTDAVLRHVLAEAEQLQREIASLQESECRDQNGSPCSAAFVSDSPPSSPAVRPERLASAVGSPHGPGTSPDSSGCHHGWGIA